MHVRADQSVCATSGQCAESVPEVFATRHDDGVVVVRTPAPDRRLWQDVRDAARRCPVAAILLTETEDRPVSTDGRPDAFTARTPHTVPEPGTGATESNHELRSLTLSGLRAAIGRLPASLRYTAEYQFGWTDEQRRPAQDSPGKLVRPTLALLCARAAGGRAEAALPAAVAVELVHNFSVLHDDVMDGDVTRRHRRTVWAAFGTGKAVLLGDALLALALQTVSALGRASATVLNDTLLDMVQGQAMDLDFEKDTTATLPESLTMAAGKTGALLRCACRLGALSAGADDDRAALFGEFGEHLGLAFQLTDDVLGIWGDLRTTGKPVHSDLRSRKKSLPVLAALASPGPAGERLALLYGRDTALPFSPGEYAELATLIEEAGGRSWTELRARRAHADALAALERARPEPTAEAGLLALADTLIHRDH
ncbi:polyprenyl synthetase family protein [Streptomyces jumonjinensis]|uniref:polyprenyl synthetase family protein n=1 Tax=Streptomyces jumonjinensis TaxID=1945 RepID=UPI0037A4D181